jgi:hypothetical protein
MWDLISSLLLLAVALVCIVVGLGTIRDVAKGRTLSLSRMSTRTYLRHENPTAFWITIAVARGVSFGRIIGRTVWTLINTLALHS